METLPHVAAPGVALSPAAFADPLEFRRGLRELSLGAVHLIWSAHGRAEHGLDLEKYARICERHTGSGLAAAEIRAQKLPLPERDYLPETPEEALVCLADKFFSKSGDMEEKPLKKIRRSLAKFGDATLARFDELCRRFMVK